MVRVVNDLRGQRPYKASQEGQPRRAPAAAYELSTLTKPPSGIGR